MAEVQLVFRTEDFHDAVETFHRALADVPGAQLSLPPTASRTGKWPTLQSSAEAAVLVTLAGAATGLRPALLLWLGKGKRVTIRRGETEIDMEGLSTAEVERVLSSIQHDDD